MRLILASGSPRRRDLIGTLDIPFDVITSGIDETRHEGEPPLDYARRLSREKAQSVADSLKKDAQTLDDVTILAADTIVLLNEADPDDVENGDLLGKPADADEARRTLRRLRGRAHTVCTAFTLLQPGASPRQHTHIEQTTVHMRHYSDDALEAYIATGDPFDKAGGYAIQHTGFSPVERIDGDYNNVVGLPLDAVRAALQDFGFSV